MSQVSFEMKKPLFIVFEGIDGSGKSTLAKNIYKKLNDAKIKSVLFNEPTGFATGQKIRSFLKGEINLSVDEQLKLFIDDRKLSVSRNIQPSLDDGYNVILDRYYFSTAAYQSSERFSPQKIVQMNQQEGFPAPDILFYLEIEPAIAMKRISQRGRTESFEKLDELFRIKNAYTKILHNAIFLDALTDEKTLAEKVFGIISEKF